MCLSSCILFERFNNTTAPVYISTLVSVLPLSVLYFRWSAISWPHKIELQMEQTYTSLEEDQERFNKIQLTDQNNFQDKLDSLQVIY